jgi:hypothetical protein
VPRRATMPFPFRAPAWDSRGELFMAAVSVESSRGYV